MRRVVLPLSLLTAIACIPEAIIESATDSVAGSATESETGSSSGDGDGDPAGDGDGDGDGTGDGDGDGPGDGDGDGTGDGDGDGDGTGDGDGDGDPPEPDTCSSLELAVQGEQASAGPSALLEFGPEDSFSVATWAYFFAAKAEQRHLLTKGDNNSNEWSITRGELGLCFNHNGVESIVCAAISEQGWHHYAVVYSAQAVRLYQDGVEIGSGNGAIGEAAGTPLTIGASEVNGSVLDGRLDDLAVWGAALSADDIADLASEQALPGDIALPLAARWRFDEGAGNVAVDASNNGLNATVAAGSWTATCPGPGICSSLELDQNGDVVVVPSTAALEYGPADSFTLGVRAYLNGPPAHIVVKGGNNTNEWSLTYNQDLCLNRQGQASLACAPAPTGRWYHYAARYDAGQVTLFLDGVEIGSGMGMVGDTAPSELKLGAIDNNNVAEGTLDEVSLWDSALTDAQIADVVGRTLAPDEIAGLQGWWRFDEGAGEVVADGSGNGHDGQLLDGDWRAICAP